MNDGAASTRPALARVSNERRALDSRRCECAEKQRRELALQEETNEKGRQELAALESTGGVDTNEHRSLREQLTEMQAQGVAVRNAEERHTAVLEQLSAIGCALSHTLP